MNTNFSGEFPDDVFCYVLKFMEHKTIDAVASTSNRIHQYIKTYSLTIYGNEYLKKKHIHNNIVNLFKNWKNYLQIPVFPKNFYNTYYGPDLSTSHVYRISNEEDEFFIHYPNPYLTDHYKKCMYDLSQADAADRIIAKVEELKDTILPYLELSRTSPIDYLKYLRDLKTQRRLASLSDNPRY